ncbi:MAG: type II toxin-antitoxin system prevent-host-death family antitoxin [Ardenticatenales bacterium]
MLKVGIRELKNEASEIIRAVREDHAQYIVTYRGEPVALIVPVDPADRDRADEHLVAGAGAHSAYWAELDDLAAKIDAAWKSDKSGVELVDEQRR